MVDTLTPRSTVRRIHRQFQTAPLDSQRLDAIMPSQAFSSQKVNIALRPLSRVSISPQRRNQGCSSQVITALNALCGVVQLLVRL